MSESTSILSSFKVKELLENGYSLTRVFLGKTVQETGKFMRDCGRAEYNAKLLPVFSYISRCTSTGISEFNQVRSEEIIEDCVWTDL